MPTLNITYTDQSIDELLALEGTCHPNSLAHALTLAIEHAAQRRALTPAEESVLAAYAVDREVNTGGFHLFFVGSTRRWAPIAVSALIRIGCPTKASFTQDAINALKLPDPHVTPDAIARVVLAHDANLSTTFHHPDRGFHWCEEDVSIAIIRHIKANRAAFPGMILRLATNAMGTRFELALEGEGDLVLRAAGEEALHEIELWHQRLSAFDQASDISRINRHAASSAWADPLPIDAELAELLTLCAGVHQASAGAFDPAIGHAMEHLGFRQEPEALAPGHGDVRATSEADCESDPAVARRLRSGLLSPTFASLLVSPHSLRLSHPNLRLDLGAVAKGWALDRAAAILRDNHVSSALLHGGTSSVIALGPPLQQPPHTIRVRSDAAPLDLPLRNAALGVSAPRGRTVEHAGATIGHVIDPRSGIPANPARADTAVVVGQSAALADAWSTAALVLGAVPPNLPAGYAAAVHTPLGWSRWGGSIPPLGSPSPLETA